MLPTRKKIVKKRIKKIRVLKKKTFVTYEEKIVKKRTKEIRVLMKKELAQESKTYVHLDMEKVKKS